MRTQFIRTLCELARRDDRVWLLCGDVGYSVLEPFAEEFASRFANTGVAEQAMTGLAAGIASTGKTVFTYSIANFPVMRCLEQIRNDVCYHGANVKICAVGGGMAYGTLGFTHFAVEDLAVMRTMPGMVVAAPCDAAEARAVARLAVSTPGPWYVRLGKDGEPVVHGGGDPVLEVGKCVALLEGADVTVFSTGAIAHEALAAANALRSEGTAVGFFTMPFVKPLDRVAVERAARASRLIVSVEEHRGEGGLGSAIAEVVAGLRKGAVLLRIHLPENLEKSGSQSYLRTQYGLDAAGIASAIREALSSGAPP